jgi:hypothetical protein
MWHDCSCTHMRAPLRHRHPDTLKYAVVLGAIKDKALRVALRAILDRSCARRPLRRVGRNEETVARSNKETVGRENG